MLGWTGTSAIRRLHRWFLRGQAVRPGDALGTQVLRDDLPTRPPRPNPAKRSAQYHRRIHNFIMKNLLAVPYVHTRPALGFERNVSGLRGEPGVERPVRECSDQRLSRNSRRKPTGGNLSCFGLPSVGSSCSSRSCIGLSILVFFWIRALPGSPAEAMLGERATRAGGRGSPGPIRTRRPDLHPVRAVPADARLRRLGRASSRTGSSPTRSGRDSRQPSSSPSWPCCSRSPSAFRSVSSRQSATAGSSTTSSLFASLIGVSIPIFFLAILLKCGFAVNLGWLPSVGRQDVLIDSRTPDQLLRARRHHYRQLERRLGRDQAPDPSGDRTWVDSPRDHRANHARLGAGRAERGLCEDGTSEGSAPDALSTGTMSFATPCCPLTPSSASRSAYCFRERFLPKRYSRSREWALGCRRRSSTATTRFSRAGFCSSRSSSSSSTSSLTSPTASSILGSAGRVDNNVSRRDHRARARADSADRTLARRVSQDKRNPGAVFGLFVIGFFIFVAIFRAAARPVRPAGAGSRRDLARDVARDRLGSICSASTTWARRALTAHLWGTLFTPYRDCRGHRRTHSRHDPRLDGRLLPTAGQPRS